MHLFMSMQNFDLTLALAGVCQSAKLVHQFSHSGNADKQAFETSINSLLILSPNSTIEIFNNDLNNLRLGLETLLEQLSPSKGTIDLEISRYWMNLIALEGKLRKNKIVTEQLGRALTDFERASHHYSVMSEQMLERIADIYIQHISPLGAKIQVQGESRLLKQPTIQVRVRSSLLTGIRAAVLWRQFGGSKMQLLFSRGKFLKTAEQIYSTL